MNLNRIHRYLVLRTTIVYIAFPLLAYSQSPGGINGHKFWYGEKDSTGLISNYHSIDLIKMGDVAKDSLLNVPVSSSIFIVLKGNFSTAFEDTLLQIGDMTLIDLGLYHGNGFTSIDFMDGASKIISVQTIRGLRLAKDTAPKVEVGNLSKFSVAEVIYYPYALNRAERRMVNSYLSIKYAIPIVRGIEPDWKDYWAKDSTYYWDANKDRAFNVRIMGLGADHDQSFYQTQSIAETGGHFRIALDSTTVVGNMPRTWIAQDGFIVFSERANSPYYLLSSCSNVRPGVNPLKRWKFRATPSWRTWANTLVIEIEKPSGLIADSIFYTDGINNYYAPWVYQNANIIRYEVDLSNIKTDRNYLFTKRSSSNQNCNSVLVMHDQSGISISSDNGLSGTMKIHSFETGVTYESVFNHQNFVPLPKGQYHVVLQNEDGLELYNELVTVYQDSSQSKDQYFPTLIMYPNPVLTGRIVTVALSGFSDAPTTWQLTDASGRVLIKQSINSFDEDITFPSPNTVGSYTFSVNTQEGVYSLKLIVAQR